MSDYPQKNDSRAFIATLLTVVISMAVMFGVVTFANEISLFGGIEDKTVKFFLLLGFITVAMIVMHVLTGGKSSYDQGDQDTL
ncbi:hypothetical protein PUV54_01290 [Hyphococcus flavus]|uniref:Uncharacterized protein n=1 Tax=Hyphococcus flavus TaxID=1866326 RepID=A0AAE9ZDV7_9PROT|nr:hypothetical protein [Hyphococcus flavus]WDI31820.1 hypothetical protein PUV54_01290 [Hyphococcus flavus]